MSRALWVLLIVPLAACRVTEDPGGWDFERMRRQPRADPYAASSFFPDGKVMQAPPEGTLPFDSVPDRREPPGPGPMGERGYAIACRFCHGAAGYGGTVMAANLAPTARFSLRTTRALRYSPDEIGRIVNVGIGQMPALGWQMDAVARQSVAAYTWRLIRTSPTDSAARADSLQAIQNAAIDSAWFDLQRRRAREAAPATRRFP